MDRKPIGGSAPPRRTGTKAPRSRPSLASSRTQPEASEAGDQITITALATASSAAITAVKSWPGRISRSHQTDRPAASSVAASRSATGRSSRA